MITKTTGRETNEKVHLDRLYGRRSYRSCTAACHGANADRCELPALALLGAAFLRRDREEMVGRTWAEAEFFDLPRRRAAGRGGPSEVLGRRRHGIGAGGARRR